MRTFTARFATTDEIARWDELVTANPNGGNLLQSEAYAETKKHYGWDIRHLVYECADYSSYNLVLEKRIPLLGRYWYLIKGPDVAGVEDLPGVLEANREFVARERLGVFAIRIEPDIVATDTSRAVIRGLGAVKVHNLQPNDNTVILNIAPDSEAVLKSLSSRGRNAVRRAMREGVEVQSMEATEENFRAMYSLMHGTLETKASVGPREFGYFRRFWGGFMERGQGHLYFVHENGVPSVGAFVINYGHKGTYKDGGSLQKRNQYGDSHLLQWQAMNDMKALGCTEYDLCGTPPSDRVKDPEHPYYGLGLFKTSFNKTVTDFVGCYDQVLSSAKYTVWTRIGERVARQIHTRRTGQQFY
ncbi:MULTISPECIES: peptidoglycan bridge formation glycyltransferase FemA/FemB family protein [Arthrobacter]|uniref:Peptidoglycan bridge formation glycyltransferase FemA/FemB family protein n=2 Tax=Arthrobacter TaxID=1663 RepID=A0ABU9KLI9_9MICC|nr:peptidoglycan bridge formation glycyltransferase FemA/FemB family protein [Arthrobacter sp. YJM1]MDP5227769.1 peptidoglycan bridge formation glycyltransferase FemA/FemB family protein [Arthrobacter sp. YJM1]